MMPFFVVRDKLRYLQKLLANAHGFQFTDSETPTVPGGVMAGSAQMSVALTEGTREVGWESYGGVVWAARKERGLSLPFLADLALTTPELLQGVALPAEETLHRIAELATRLTLHPHQDLTDHGPDQHPGMKKLWWALTTPTRAGRSKIQRSHPKNQRSLIDMSIVPRPRAPLHTPPPGFAGRRWPSRVYPGESAQAAWVRSDQRADLHRLKDLSDDPTDTMVLCASEMFANGVDHSRSGQAGGRVIRTLTMPTAHTVHLALVD